MSGRSRVEGSTRSFLCGALLVLAVTACASPTKTPEGCGAPLTVRSRDGVPIAYECQGEGDVTLVLVHGWSCDRGYWREQVAHFSSDFRVVLVDLAGHGQSGTGRSRYTMQAFGEDVAAVVAAIDARRVILVGHSMGGGVIAETARLIPERVIGLVGVDTLQDVGYSMTSEALEEMVRPFEEDFTAGMRDFLSTMFVADSDEELVAWIRSDMSAAPREVAISALREYLVQYVTGEAARVFHEIDAPVYCVNTTSWPTATESNRRHIRSFQVAIVENAGHFLMLEQPGRFNEELARILAEITARSAETRSSSRS